MQEKPLTPLMQQYFALKASYPDTILLFQVGDFYELFFEDAQTAASILGIALTKRGTHGGEPIPLCGVPLHVKDHYLTKLVKAGFKVALCDQLTEPRPGKLVDRGITQVLTPGTLTDTRLLEEKSASYLAVFYAIHDSWSLLCAELLTGHLIVTLFKELTLSALEAEIGRFMPDEIVVLKTATQFISFFHKQGVVVSTQDTPSYEDQCNARVWMGERIKEPIDSESFQKAVELLYTYLKKNNEQGLIELKQISPVYPEDYVRIDAATQRNLELVKNNQDGSYKHTLFAVLDKAVTPMGSRILKKWILRPLLAKNRIEERQAAIEILVKDHSSKIELRAALKSVGDLERTCGRIALKRAHLHDYRSLVAGLQVVPALRKQIDHLASKSNLWKSLANQIGDYSAITSLLASSIHDDTATEWVIKKGYNSELDHLRSLVAEGSQAVALFEQREQEKTGISSLKVKFNQVHGYGIEITKTNLHLVPHDYVRIQTLANRERFTTQELKNLEYDIKRARADSVQLEKDLYEEVKQQVEQHVPALKKGIFALAYADCLQGLAQVAYLNSYVKPQFSQETFRIIDGRHPVVETRLNERYIPNSVELTQDSYVWIITGPNMGGKSTFLRQVALISIMAQIGSFVPALEAHLTIVDRVFTRIGASDNVAEGKSTFLVEMEETALICTQATKDSLVILDEVGRGTSTFDGLAIAQAVVEYLHAIVKTRCLFATHYHELTALCSNTSGIKPFYAASRKVGNEMVLLHKILPGVADGSFGLEVASLAQLPDRIVSRAREIVHELNHADRVKKSSEPAHLDSANHRLAVRVKELEASLAQLMREREKDAYLAARLEKVDYDNITPRQALNLVWELTSRKVDDDTI